MNTRWIAILAALGLATSAAAAVNLYVEPTKQLEPSPAAEPEAKKPWSLEINLDSTTAYIYRGYNSVNQGLIVQPSVEFDYTIYDSNGFTITPYIGTWHNITSQRLGEGEPRSWAEADVYPGVKFGYGNFELDVYYDFIAYPNQSARRQQELDIALSYDDSEKWGSSDWFAGFQPHVGVYIETQDHNDHDCNTYLEWGIEPTAKPIEMVKWPVTFSVPVLLGTSPDHYFADSDGQKAFFGYVSAGLKASAPVNLLPGADCTLTAEVDWINLLADSTEEANHGSNNAVTGRLGIKAEF